MLNIYILLPVMTLCVIGVYFLIKEIAAVILKNSIGSSVILEIRDDADGVENAVRTALRTNPSSDIIVIDESGSDEIGTILRHLSLDYERVHIKQRKEAPEK